MTIDLTTEERRLVLDLLQLWEAAYENPHGRLCECRLCAMTEKCGDHTTATFESLYHKIGKEV